MRLVDVPSFKKLSDERQAEINESREKMKWRLKPGERKTEWYTSFKLFMQDDDNTAKEYFVTKLQKPLDLRPSNVKKWIYKKIEKRERFFQQFIPERHSVLGNDLAAAHFLVYRNARVKFVGEDNWVKMDKKEGYSLPNKYVHGYFLEAIDCEGTIIYYEGLENIRRLRKLEYLSFKNIKSFDDWCLDRVSGSELEKLEVLDLSGTSISYRGIQALYRVPTLKKLILDNPHRDTEWELMLALLQEIIPDLEIVESKIVAESVKN